MSILTEAVPSCEVCHVIPEDITSLKNEGKYHADYWLCVDPVHCIGRVMQQRKAAS